MNEYFYYNRELSWLSFNYRVLQEASDPQVPLFEKIKFLAIYSSNLDEFFRVRVASLRSLLNLKKKTQGKLKFDPQKLLKQIQREVHKQQDEFGRIFHEIILPGLQKNNIYLINDTNANKAQKEFARIYFIDNVKQYVQPILIVKKRIIPFLQNHKLYLAVKLAPKIKSDRRRIRHNYALVEIPTDRLPRFVSLPSEGNKSYVMFLDDIIRINLHDIFEHYKIAAVNSIKLTRDAELYIEDEFSGDLLNKIKKGLKQRNTGVPSRFLYDSDMPKDFLKFIKESLLIHKEDLIAGAKYHNFNDFFSFPVRSKKNLTNTPLAPSKKDKLENNNSIFDSIKKGDIGFHFPYQSYNYIVDFLRQAADDTKVKSIKITQYRVADHSKIIRSLLDAVNNGKEVMAFVELKARFDEESNIRWAEEMENSGIKVYYSFPGLKVHSKIALIEREEKNNIQKYCYLGTGNFNEKTAKLYCDFGLLTAQKEIAEEVEQVFEFLAGIPINFKFKHLLVAQFNMRKKLIKLIDKEIEAAENGTHAGIILKLNSLEDNRMISKLYDASNAGVKIQIIVRGICCLVPGVKGMSENIKVISIVDRFLEHARFYIFHNGGNKKYYASSADWMKRNLNRRIEVGFPIYDKAIKKEISDIISLQLKDNVKARVINRKNDNRYKGSRKKDSELLQSQIATYNYLKSKNN